MSARSSADRAATVLRQGVELGLREIGQSPEMRAARRAPVEAPRGPRADDAPRVLVLSPRDWAVHVQWEALIGRALAARGADVRFATCGGGLETCDRVNVHEGPPPPCHTCSRYTGAALGAHGLPVAELAPEYPDPAWPELDALTLDELRQVSFAGIPLGELVDVPVKWFLCSAALDRDPIAVPTYRAFLRSARRIAVAAAARLDRDRPDVVVMLNGMFLFEAVVATLARARGVRVVTYERAHVDGLLFFAHDEPACRYSSEQAWKETREQPLTDAQDAELDAYLTDRRRGLRSFVQIWPEPRFDVEPEARTERRRVVLFTNVTWDSAAIGLDGAFGDVREWLVDTLRHLVDRTDVDVVVRIHPSEVVLPKWRTREPMQVVIDAAFPSLPPHVRVVAPDDPTSSYVLLDGADVGLVYTSTVGLELALAGVPTLVGGRPHYAGKGFTLEATDPADHTRVLDGLLDDPDAFVPDIETARRYAHLFFFSANVARPPASEPVSGLVRLDPDFARRVAPGGDAGLDAICAGILTGAPFRVAP
jgi:hypothetical protein